MANKSLGTDPSKFTVGGTRQNELFEVLSHPRRRFLLQYLQTTETPLSVAELTSRLEEWEHEQSPLDQSGGEKDSVEVALFHSHLPIMAEAGFVTFDSTEQTVALADRTDEVQAHLPRKTSD